MSGLCYFFLTGSVLKRLRYGGIFTSDRTRNLLLSLLCQHLAISRKEYRYSVYLSFRPIDYFNFKLFQVQI